MVVWLSTLGGCGSTSHSHPDAGNAGQGGSAAGGTATAGAAGSKAQAGAAGMGGSTSVSMPVPTCDDPPPLFGSCYSGNQCAQGANEFAASVTNSICFPGLGLSPSDKPCNDFQLLGRCFERDPGVWRFYYNAGGPPGVASLQRTCEDNDGPWCTNPTTIPSAVANICVAACNAARPDYTDEPECAQADSCNNDCWERLTNHTIACAECVAASLSWAPGSCGSFECSCPPAQFDACADVCAPN